VQLGTTQEKLKRAGVEVLAVVNTPVERARLYFNYRPTRVLLAADPGAAAHRAFGVPAVEVVEDDAAAQWPWRSTIPRFEAALINPTGELPSPRNAFEANTVLNEKDGFKLTEVDEQIAAAHATQLAGHSLLNGWAWSVGRTSKRMRIRPTLESSPATMRSWLRHRPSPAEAGRARRMLPYTGRVC
jgi:hypothetical protein